MARILLLAVWEQPLLSRIKPSKIRAGVSMAEWLTKWQSWFHKPSKAAGVQLPPDPKFWSLSQNQPLIWEVGELDLLRACERHTTRCTATQESTGDTLQTVVLGFESDTQRLLLDEFFPVHQLPLPGQKFQLSLASRTGILILEVIVRDSIWIARNPAYVVEILGKKRLSDRRALPRVVFAGRDAPNVDLLLPLTPALRGQLLDLSAKGCAINCFGPQKPQLYSRKGQCRIRFSDACVMTVDIQITQVSFQRQPCRHTLFRARFQPLPLATQEQLSAFMHSYESLSSRHAQTH
jgi:hypothetical protein